MTISKTKGFLAAALTSATLLAPAAAQADDVFGCVVGELDSRIANLTNIFDGLNSNQTAHGSMFTMGDMDATYSYDQKMDIIHDCEQKTGRTSDGIAEGLTKYSNGGPVTLHFAPR